MHFLRAKVGAVLQTPLDANEDPLRAKGVAKKLASAPARSVRTLKRGASMATRGERWPRRGTLRSVRKSGSSQANGGNGAFRRPGRPIAEHCRAHRRMIPCPGLGDNSGVRITLGSRPALLRLFFPGQLSLLKFHTLETFVTTALDIGRLVTLNEYIV